MNANTLLPRRALVAGLMLALGACSEGLTTINNNPNAPTDVDAEFILPQAIRVAVDVTYNPFPMMLSHTLRRFSCKSGSRSS